MPDSGTARRPAFQFGRSHDPLLAVIWLLVILLGSLAVLQRRVPPAGGAPAAGLPGRILELQAFALELSPASSTLLPKLTRNLAQPWDRALGAVLAAESKDLATARPLAFEGPEAPGPGADFRTCFHGAYEGGDLPPEERWPAVFRALGQGYGARLLEARLLERKGDPVRARALRDTARRNLGARFAGFAVLGAAVLGLFLAGLAFGVFLIVTRKVPPRLELQPSPLGGRSLAAVFGLWALCLLLSGSLVAGLLHLAPALKPYALFLAYGTHAAAGLLLLAAAEGRPLGAVLARLGSKAPLRSLGWASGFLALAVALVVGVALVLSPLLKSAQPPQRELMEMIQGTGGILPTVLLFFTMAVVAPCFEELMFRGTLLPWLQSRLGASWAIPLSALAFAAIHLQPLALPTLFTLGAVLGLAARRTGGLLAPIAVHAAWNGSVFLLMKLMA
jgi:membrane protease YdiL (CAAX protease family)